MIMMLLKIIKWMKNKERLETGVSLWIDHIPIITSDIIEISKDYVILLIKEIQNRKLIIL